MNNSAQRYLCNLKTRVSSSLRRGARYGRNFGHWHSARVLPGGKDSDQSSWILARLKSQYSSVHVEFLAHLNCKWHLLSNTGCANAAGHRNA